MTKLTKKVALSYAVATLTDAPMTCEFSKDEIVAKLIEMIDGLDKKSTGEKKLTDQQVANLGYKADILTYLADGQPKTATEILKGVTTFPEDMSNQRVSQLLRQLILDGKVSKETIKGKTLFKVVEG
jgi:predicted HTH transcriptional regulator